MNAHQIILKSLVSEKGTQLEEIQTYCFVVAKKSTKVDVKKAIKSIFGAEAKEVRIIISPEKTKQIKKGSAVKRKELKKAYVTLKDRAKLDLTKLAKAKKDASKAKAADQDVKTAKKATKAKTTKKVEKATA